MYINFDVYSPETARVSFDLPNVEDETLRFRVCVIKKENPRLIAYWQYNESGSEWLTPEALLQDFGEQPLQRGDTIRVEKKATRGARSEVRAWDTERIWPVNADGESMIEIRRCF